MKVISAFLVLATLAVLCTSCSGALRSHTPSKNSFLEARNILEHKLESENFAIKDVQRGEIESSAEVISKCLKDSDFISCENSDEMFEAWRVGLEKSATGCFQVEYKRTSPGDQGKAVAFTVEFCPL
eukprot:Nk52_evm38s163 gene=Nk52_evmTU38s163